MMARNADAFIGIRVPEPVKQAWLQRAKQEQRSLSNWIVHKLVSDDKPSSKPTIQGKKVVNG